MHKPQEKKKLRLGYLIKNLSTFLAPYKWSFWGAIGMVVITVIALVIAPSVEGMITTQLAKDAADLFNKVPGASVQFGIIIKIIFVLIGVYLVKNRFLLYLLPCTEFYLFPKNQTNSLMT